MSLRDSARSKRIAFSNTGDRLAYYVCFGVGWTQQQIGHQHVKGRKLNTQALKKDSLVHPFSQFRTSFRIIGCVWGALRAKGVISENLFEKGVSTESLLELISH